MSPEDLERQYYNRARRLHELDAVLQSIREERAGLQPSQMGDLEVQQQIQKAQPKPFPAKQEGPPRG